MAPLLTRRAGLRCAAAALVFRGAPTRAAAAEEAGFRPVRVAHARGETVLARRPRRVVAVGYSDLAVARALGVPLVGAMRYAAGPDGLNFPWVAPLDEAVACLPAGAVDLEAIWALEPDLILAATAYHAYEEAYPALAAIAPTLVHARGNLRDPGADLARVIGRLVGAERAAERLVAASETAVSAFAARHPELQGRSLAYAQVAPRSFHPIVDPSALALDLFRRLGLVQPASLGGLEGPFDCNGSVALGHADLRRLEAAEFALVAPVGTAGRAAAERLPAAGRGRLRLVDQTLYDALVAPNPVNVPFILARLETLLGGGAPTPEQEARP